MAEDGMDGNRAQLVAAEELLNDGDLEGARAVLEAVLERSPELEEGRGLLVRLAAAEESREFASLPPTPVPVEERHSPAPAEAVPAAEAGAAGTEAQEAVPPGATAETGEAPATADGEPDAPAAVEVAAVAPVPDLSAHADEIDQALARLGDVDRALEEIEPVLRTMGDEELAAEIRTELEARRPPPEEAARPDASLPPIATAPPPVPAATPAPAAARVPAQARRPRRAARPSRARPVRRLAAAAIAAVAVALIVWWPAGEGSSSPAPTEALAAPPAIPASDAAPEAPDRLTDAAHSAPGDRSPEGLEPGGPAEEARSDSASAGTVSTDDAAPRADVDRLVDLDRSEPSAPEPANPLAPPPPPAMGSLIVDASPWARVAWIRRADGSAAPLGDCRNTPCILRLPAGAYEVALQHPDFPPRTVSARVVAGQTEMVIGKLADRNAEDVLVDIER